MRQITSKEAGRIERGNLRAVPLRFRPRAQPVYSRRYARHEDAERMAAQREREVLSAQRQERLKESVERAVAAGLGFFKKRGVAQKGQ